MPVSDQALPTIAVIIPILNEGTTLGPTFDSLVSQDYPRQLLEVLIVDGGSSDHWEHALDRLDRHNIAHRTLKNPRRSTSAAVNLALRATDAPYVLWLSGHCKLSPAYIRLAVDASTAHENIVAGGRLTVQGNGVIGRLNALVLRSRFGGGIAPWRRRGQVGWTDSATYALFDRQRFLDAGGLDERLLRNQDNELTVRLRKQGTRFLLTNATSTYIAPATLGGLWQRAWKNGSWVVWSWKLGMAAFSWYHLVPPVAVASALILACLSVWSQSALYALAVLVTLYAVLSVGFAASVALRGRALWAFPVLPFLFLLLHTVHGAAVSSALFRSAPSPRDSKERHDGNMTMTET